MWLTLRDVKLIGTGVVVTVVVGASVVYIRRHWRTRRQTVAGADSRPKLNAEEKILAADCEKVRLHKELNMFLNDNIGNNGNVYRLDSMKYFAGSHIGKAEADNCSNFMELFNKLETKGLVKRGNYTFLVEKIMYPAEYKDPDVMKRIEETQRLINDAVSSYRGPEVVASPQTTRGTGGGTELYDGVLLYTENDRDEAINFLAAATRYVGDAQIKLTEELGFGNLTGLTAMEKITNQCRYVFVLMTDNFTDDALLRFQTQMCLDDFIRNNEFRVVPVWTESSGRVRYPKELNLLSGLKYHLLQKEGANKYRYHNVFIKGLQKLIQSGRGSILVRGEA